MILTKMQWNRIFCLLHDRGCPEDLVESQGILLAWVANNEIPEPRDEYKDPWVTKDTINEIKRITQ